MITNLIKLKRHTPAYREHKTSTVKKSFNFSPSLRNRDTKSTLLSMSAVNNDSCRCSICGQIKAVSNDKN